MNTWQILIIIFCGLGLVQSLFLGVSLILKDRLNLGALFYFGVLLIGLALRLAKSYFVFIPQKYPHWGVVAGGAGLWMIGPAFLLYTLHAIDTRRKSQLTYLVHFIPATLIVASAVTEYVYYIGIAHFLIYFAIGVYLFMRADTNGSARHFKVFAACVGLVLLSFTLQAIINSIEAYALGIAVAIGALYVINYFMVRESDFFASFVRKPRDISKDVSERIMLDLKRVFDEKRIYRNKGLSIADVAREINHPAYLISQAINQQHQIRFNEFVNRYRVQEAMEKLKSANDKVEVIAREVGFASTSSLYDSFKKETKLTPQSYRNQVVENIGRNV